MITNTPRTFTKTLLYLVCILTVQVVFGQGVPIEPAVSDERKDEVYDLIYLAWDFVFDQNDSALIYCQQALELSREYGFLRGESLSIEARGLYHENVRNDYDSASFYYFKAITFCEENDLPHTATLYHSIGAMFHNLDNYELAKKYYTISHDLGIQEGDSINQKQCLMNLASVHSSLGEYEEAERLFIACLEFDASHDLDYGCYANLGNMYVRMQLYQKAIPYLEKSTIEHPDNFLADANIRLLLDAKTGLKDTSGMQPYLLRADSYLRNRVEFRNTRLMLNSLSKYHEMAGNYEQALEYNKQSVTIHEEQLEKQKEEAVLNVEAAYQTQKIEDELHHQESLQRIYTYSGGVAFILILILSLLFAINRKKNKELSLQKKHLENTVDEKNVLLRETHHRIKNSFQLVSSLLYLQSENSANEEAKIAIKEAENRVRSMVLIHQKLYTSDQLIGIESKEYFTSLSEDIFESHQYQPEDLNYHLDIESMVLSVETITPLGLILNELIVNVLKHAFDSMTSDTNMIVTFKKAQDHLILSVADNGKGMDGNVRDGSFGISLMRALSKKIGGELNYSSASQTGTVATLLIKRFELLAN